MIRLKSKHLTAEFDPLGAAICRLFWDGLQIADKGVTVGRYANRIAGDSLSINGKTFPLSVNENGNTLHGGAVGFSKRRWSEEVLPEENAVVFRLVSDDGDQGFPGTMQAEVRYTVQDSSIWIDYRASADRDTVINLTNHAYFNLNGIDDTAAAAEHDLYLNADSYLEVDAELIPTGKLLPVDGTVFDFRKQKRYPCSFDHNFVLNGGTPAAILRGCRSGLTMQVLTDRPGIQLYNTKAQICLETQNFPDAVHHPHFPAPFLRKGEIFQSATIYQFQ